MKKESKYILYCVLIILFTLISIITFAQNKKLDSLWTVYKDKTQHDTVRFKAIHAAANMLVFNNPDTSLILIEQELNFAKSMPDAIRKKWIANSFNIKGVAFMNKGNFPEALENYENALNLFEEIGNKKGMGNIYNNMAGIYFYQANYPKALEFYL